MEQLPSFLPPSRRMCTPWSPSIQNQGLTFASCWSVQCFSSRWCAAAFRQPHRSSPIFTIVSAFWDIWMIALSSPPLTSFQSSSASFFSQKLGIVLYRERSDLELRWKRKYLRMVISAMRDDHELRVSNLREVADQYLPQPSSPLKLWQWIWKHMTLTLLNQFFSWPHEWSQKKADRHINVWKMKAVLRVLTVSQERPHTLLQSWRASACSRTLAAVPTPLAENLRSHMDETNGITICWGGWLDVTGQ